MQERTVQIYSPPKGDQPPLVVATYNHGFIDGLSDAKIAIGVSLTVEDGVVYATPQDGVDMSARAAQYLAQRSRGVLGRDIAASQYFKVSTISDTLSREYARLGVRNGPQAVRRAMALGIIDAFIASDAQLAEVRCLAVPCRSNEVLLEELALASYGLNNVEAAALSGNTSRHIKDIRQNILDRLQAGSLAHAVGIAASYDLFGIEPQYLRS